MIYLSILRPLLFLLDAETAHRITFYLLGCLVKLRIPIKWFVKTTALSPAEQTEVFGLKFPNRLGLAAGFDKNAKLMEVWKQLGFGFIEIGTVTPKPQKGNDTPRLFRLVKDEALINRMGFNNDGCDAIVERLKKRPKGLIVGGNIGKNKDTSQEQAIEDYRYCMQSMHSVVDFFTINISSPNTPGLRNLQDKEPLMDLLSSLATLNSTFPHPRPLLLKIAPDLSENQLDDVIEVVKGTKIDGLIATNTTISREGLSYPITCLDQLGSGGLSGKPLLQRSNEVLGLIIRKTEGKLPVVAVGGVMNGEDAVTKLNLGAELVQVYSGFVYRGPELIVDIRKAIQRFLS
jgi:dihydroorotate dehydrogenase